MAILVWCWSGTTAKKCAGARPWEHGVPTATRSASMGDERAGGMPSTSRQPWGSERVWLHFRNPCLRGVGAHLVLVWCCPRRPSGVTLVPRRGARSHACWRDPGAALPSALAPCRLRRLQSVLVWCWCGAARSRARRYRAVLARAPVLVGGADSPKALRAWCSHHDPRCSSIGTGVVLMRHRAGVVLPRPRAAVTRAPALFDRYWRGAGSAPSTGVVLPEP
jgi:hypothetical protein